MSRKALEGIRILDFGSFIAGPAGSMVMGFFGAEVIKVEHPTRFDGGRRFQTGVGFPPPDPTYGTQFFDVSNMNKHSLVLDYSTEEGANILWDLIDTIDILMENMVPGSLAKYGFDYESVKKRNPGIIYVSSSSCGQTGPERRYRGYAGHFAAKSGLALITGYDDARPPVYTGGVDFRSSTNAVAAMMMALIYRQQTKIGQYVDLASQEAIAAQLGDVYLNYILNGVVQKREGDRREGYCPNMAFRAKGEDEWFTISCYSDDEFKALCQEMGQPELAKDERFSDYDARKSNEDELNGIIETWTKDKDKFDLWNILIKKDVPCAPSMSAKDVCRDPHNILMTSCKAIDHPLLGRDFVVNPPWRWTSGPEVSIECHAPELGNSTRKYLKELGRSDEEIARLEEEKIILVYPEN